MLEIESIATIASHSALQIMKGAKQEGFRTALICLKDRINVYSRFRHLIDNYLIIREYKDIVSKGIQKSLLDLNAIIIPHGSFVEYVGVDNIYRIECPVFGNRKLLEWEHNQFKKYELLKSAEISVPKVYNDPSEVDRLVIVKLPGAKGGQGYFLAKNKNELIRKANKLKINLAEALIQEYIIGTPMYFQYFYSPLFNRLELLGSDIRYESNIDGLKRIPFHIADPTFTVVGNIPVVLRESLLSQVFDYGEKFVSITKEKVPPGAIGPYCLEAVCTNHLKIIVFEFSGRIVAGTNLYIMGSPYSWLYFDEPMSMGRRIAREIKLALENNELNKVIS